MKTDHWVTLEVGEDGFVGTMHCAHPIPSLILPFDERPKCWQPMLDEYDENENQLPDLSPRMLERGKCLIRDWYENEGEELWKFRGYHEIESLPLYVEYWWDSWESLCIKPVGMKRKG